jgi:quinol-cytochrome oxidoreductase complex cytochrome b subunit
MSLFNRNVKNGKEKAEENGQNGNGNGNGLRARIAENAQRFMPHLIKEALPYFVEARKSREGREKLVEKAKEIAYEQADYTTRAVTAGMGIADTRAFFRGDPPIEKPNPRYKVHVNAFFAHIRPKYYDKASTRFTHTFGLGFLSAYTFFVEVITGVILMVFYTPSDRRAYEDMIKIISEVPFGQLMRDIHRVGAELMVLFVVLHMTRVFLTGSFKHPRTFTWLTGAILLILTFALSYTGYLLPWDQLAYWAVTIGSSMFKSAPPKEIVGVALNLLVRGSDTIGQNGLLRFYLVHVFAFPALALIFISVHYYRVARTHSISIPAAMEESADPAVRKAAKERIDYLPEIFTRELLWLAIATFAVVVFSAWFFHGPLEHHSDPFRTPLHSTAPWYFLWIQGLLKDAFLLPALRFSDQTLTSLLQSIGLVASDSKICMVCFYDSPTVMGVIVPTIITAIVLGFPYINEYWEKLWGSKPSRQLIKNRKGTLAVAVLSTIFLVVIWYQGTPFFGVVAPPEVELGQTFMPEEPVLPPVPLFPEDPGAVRKLGYEKLPVGKYALDQYLTAPAQASPFERMLVEMAQDVRAQRELAASVGNTTGASNLRGRPDMKGTLVIDQWAPNLKKINLQLRWKQVGAKQQVIGTLTCPAETGCYDKIIYLHAESRYE